MKGGKSGQQFVKGTVRLKLDRPKNGTIVQQVVTSNAVFLFYFLFIPNFSKELKFLSPLVPKTFKLILLSLPNWNSCTRNLKNAGTVQCTHFV